MNKGDPQGNVQYILLWTYEQVVYVQLRIRSEKLGAQTSLGFRDKNGSPDLGPTTRPSDI